MGRHIHGTYRRTLAALATLSKKHVVAGSWKEGNAGKVQERELRRRSKAMLCIDPKRDILTAKRSSLPQATLAKPNTPAHHTNNQLTNGELVSLLRNSFNVNLFWKNTTRED
jgi:hypothetical protein